MRPFESTNLSEDISGSKLCMSLSETYMEAVWGLRKDKHLADATILLDDGKEFRVHRAILAVGSDFFRTIFVTSLSKNKSTQIHLPAINSEIMDLILDYLYMRKIKITPTNVGPLLATSDFLCVMGVKELCSEHLKLQLTPTNCLSIYMFARDYYCKTLEMETRRYIMRNFVEVAKYSTELLKCPVDVMEAILGSDELNVKSEETVWEAVLKWINHEPQNRKKCLVRLMSKIRLGLMETEYFLENIKDHPLVVNNEDCRPVVIETLKCLYDLETITQQDGELLTPEIARPRFPNEILFAIGGWSGGSPTNVIETYDTRADRWMLVKEVDITGPRAYHATAVIGFDIYVLGGFDGTDYFNSCRCFDAVNKTWREVAPMNSKRCYVSAVVLDDLIYAMGGYDGHHRQNTVERYNPKTNQWTPVTPMHCQRSDASATILNRKIYITGGFNGTECLNSAEMFDPETRQWTMIPPMRSRRSGVSCTTYHNCIYVIGGFNGIARMNSGEKFDPNTNVWSSIPDMYTPRSNFAIEVIDDMVFVIGGFNGVTTIYNVECYDEKHNEWYEATEMIIYRSAVSACVIAGLPNTADYIHKHRESLIEERRQRLMGNSSQWFDDNENVTNQHHQQNNTLHGMNRANNAFLENALINLVDNLSGSEFLAIENAQHDQEDMEE